MAADNWIYTFKRMKLDPFFISDIKNGLNNPSNVGGNHWEDWDSRPTLAKS
jgi:hypothetical protein